MFDIREMLEETNLEVSIERLLFEYTLPNDHTYKTRKTYLCHIVSGQARPGYDPEEDGGRTWM